jgi:hypothetical protein
MKLSLLKPYLPFTTSSYLLGIIQTSRSNKRLEKQEIKIMKSLKVAGIAVIVVLALGVLGVGLVFAQQPTQSPWGRSGMMGNGWNGSGMMGGYSQDGNGADWMNDMHQWMTATGGMHTLVWDRLAEALGLTTDELNAELSSGKTLAQIAEKQGISQEELSVTLETTVQAGLKKAVAEGVLTQEQADSMRAHMSGNYAWMLTQMGTHMGTGYDLGPGGCHGNVVPQNNR